MTSLPNSRAADVNLTIEIIEMINRLIRIYENVYTGNWETGGNKVIKILENIYNFTSGILSEIFNSTKNAILM